MSFVFDQVDQDGIGTRSTPARRTLYSISGWDSITSTVRIVFEYKSFASHKVGYSSIEAKVRQRDF